MASTMRSLPVPCRRRRLRLASTPSAAVVDPSVGLQSRPSDNPTGVVLSTLTPIRLPPCLLPSPCWVSLCQTAGSLADERVHRSEIVVSRDGGARLCARGVFIWSRPC